MAYVITAVGAGGKTTYLRQRALEYLRQGKKTAVTTSTHIWPPDPVPQQSGPDKIPSVFLRGMPYGSMDDMDMCVLQHCRIKEEREALPPLDYIGVPEPSGKLRAPGVKTYEKICREYDVVLVEGDGSHCMPAKIPSAQEPVIPDNTNEIAVIMGAHAIGRRIDVVCHRYEGRSRGKMTQEMLEEIARRYYLIPLGRQYPKAEVFYVLSRMPSSSERIAGVVMASGFGRRYGKNKLLDRYQGMPLYRHTLDHVRQAVGEENTVVVTQYETIRNQVRETGIDCIMNHEAGEGIAASIRLGTLRALEMGADAVMFFAADMPCLPSEEIRLCERQFLASSKPYGCMVYGREHTLTNPGAFRLKKGAEKLLRLKGDRGAMRIMRQEPWNIYYYQTAPEYVKDIDFPQTE